LTPKTRRVNQYGEGKYRHRNHCDLPIRRPGNRWLGNLRHPEQGEPLRQETRDN